MQKKCSHAICIYVLALFLIYCLLQIQQMMDSYSADVDKQLATKTKELLGWRGTASVSGAFLASQPTDLCLGQYMIQLW